MRQFFFNAILLVTLALSTNYVLAQTKIKSHQLTKEQLEPFELNAKILNEYPNLQSLPADIKLNVSATYQNIKTVDTYLTDVLRGQSTGDIEYHLWFVGETINKLKKSNNSELDKFIKDHEKKLADVSGKAKSIVGNKKRGRDGYYR